MIKLTLVQRGFLDRYYMECTKPAAGPAVALGAEHGFYYEHMLALYDAYVSSWGGTVSVWGDIYPPESFSPLVFPWSSIQELEAQIEAEGIKLNPLPREKTFQSATATS
jgi:hypothetical protein